MLYLCYRFWFALTFSATFLAKTTGIFSIFEERESFHVLYLYRKHYAIFVLAFLSHIQYSISQILQILCSFLNLFSWWSSSYSNWSEQLLWCEVVPTYSYEVRSPGLITGWSFIILKDLIQLWRKCCFSICICKW